ncbi:hypothetical protein [Haliangium ochraceum]|uniref:Uncharacterized protein n=1 Tax=Haliangium ochraceum (strain DSM 14365 / JCM 11303 / SMP-2) TaxID=502025 RepID=D0LKE7_HALO1|nr:hypothetical protein [Haliangium ochraceum]ACY14995.1 hypothetical protein Hoch_2459 [Haliangium ochraceum DSM 14365]
MNRRPVFQGEAIEGMRGLASLTEPGDDEPVGAIVDLAVMGARGDGKTQFIVHAIRTLRAYAPPLTGAEQRFHRDILDVVMNAHAPRPEATPPGVVPHYVFRIRPPSLLSQLDLGGRLSLYRRTAGLTWHWLLAALNALALGALLGALRGGMDGVSYAAAGLALAAGVLGGLWVSRRRFLRRGAIEIVFWDVAGEHVYRGSAADYYGFLGALAAQRRERATRSRAYAFAPVLLCNPVALGTRPRGSSYTRLRKLLPMFASLGDRLPRALVAINRFSVVDWICPPESDRDELVAIAPRPRAPDELAEAGPDAETGAAPGTGADVTGEDAPIDARERLPVVRRDVVRAHCLDAEDGRDGEMDLSYLRYDAGMQCELSERAWSSWDALDDDLRATWAPPAEDEPARLVDYVYEDGPGAFEGEAQHVFLGWLARLAFHPLSYGGAGRAPVQAGPAAELDAVSEPDFAGADERWTRGSREHEFGDAFGDEPGPRAWGRNALAPAAGADADADADAEIDANSNAGPNADAGGDDDEPILLSPRARRARARSDSRPGRAMSASGLEDFARGALSNRLDSEAPSAEEQAAGAQAMSDKSPREKKSDTLPLSGGFGSSGT